MQEFPPYHYRESRLSGILQQHIKKSYNRNTIKICSIQPLIDKNPGEIFAQGFFAVRLS